MSMPAGAYTLEEPAKAVRIDRKSREWQDAQWRKWPTAADWPGVMDLYEAAAYRRVGYGTIWRACQTGRDGKAALAHQRFGDTYRVSKAALDRIGVVGECA